MDKPEIIRPRISRAVLGDIVLSVLGFFMGRAQVFGVLSPFAAAYAASALFEGGLYYIYAVFAAIGLATRFSPVYSVKYVLAFGMLTAINAVVPRIVSKSSLRAMHKSLAAGAVMLFSGLIPAFMRGITLYSVVVSVLEGVLTLSFSFILIKSRKSLTEKNTVFSVEELAGAAFFAGGIILGAADVWVGAVSLRYLFCGLASLFAVYKTGAAAGAAAGLILGLLMCAAGYESADFAVVLSVSSLVCGLCERFGKAVFSLVFVAAVSTGSAYFGFWRPELLISSVLSGVLFFILPSDKFMRGINHLLAPALLDSSEYAERVKRLSAQKLSAFSQAILKLSNAFGGLSNNKPALRKAEANNLIDNAAESTCLNCIKRGICWEERLLDTYQAALGLLAVCERDGRIVPAGIPKTFRDFCHKSWEFCEAVNRFHGLYKSNLKWKSTVNESRLMAAEQLRAVSGLIGELAEELTDPGRFIPELEKKIKLELLKNKIEVEQVLVLQTKDGRYEVGFSQKRCGYQKKCNNAAAVVGSVLGKRMRKDEPDCELYTEKGRGMCRVRLVEERRLYVTCGVARAASVASGHSGDNYSRMELKDGCCMLVLADGMGTGRAADEESRVAVELFEDFMESGFDRHLAVRLINSALLLRSADESFSTMDICAIDLRDGSAEFIKMGASSTILVSEGEIETIRSYSLPVGAVGTVDPDTARRRLKHGDIVIMMTDGVVESSPGEREAWVIAALGDCGSGTINPQDIADFLLSEATRNYRGDVRDDMTVMVSRIWEKK